MQILKPSERTAENKKTNGELFFSNFYSNFVSIEMFVPTIFNFFHRVNFRKLILFAPMYHKTTTFLVCFRKLQLFVALYA